MNKTFKLAALAAVAFAMTACGGGGDDDNVSGGGDPFDQPISAAPAMVQEFATHLNAARAQARVCGDTPAPAVQPLTKWNPRLQDAAQGHADDMNANGFFSHTGSDGSTAADRRIRSGYKGFGIAENLMRGEGSAQRFVEVWLNSPGHCRALMTDTAKTVAVARRGIYTVMLYGD